MADEPIVLFGEVLSPKDRETVDKYFERYIEDCKKKTAERDASNGKGPRPKPEADQ
jgi:hypothetical protein